MKMTFSDLLQAFMITSIYRQNQLDAMKKHPKRDLMMEGVFQGQIDRLEKAIEELKTGTTIEVVRF